MTLPVVGNVIHVAVGNETHTFTSNSVKNITLGVFNVSLDGESTRIVPNLDYSVYNFTFIIQYRVTPNTSISFSGNRKKTTIHVQCTGMSVSLPGEGE